MSHMPRGYVIVSRCLLDHPVVGIRSGHTAHWLDLLARAAGVDGYKGLRRGELQISRRTLASDWGVSEKVVRNFLVKLQEQNMLQKGAQKVSEKGPKTGRDATVYAVVNFDKYQDAPEERAHEGAQKVAKKGPPKIQKGNTVKENRPSVFVDSAVDPDQKQIDLEEAISAAKTDAEKVADLWNDLATRTGLAKVTVLSPGRRKAVNARLKDAGGLDGVKQVIDYIATQPVLLGKQKFSDGRTWKATFDYLVRPEKFAQNLDKARAEQKPASTAKREINDWGPGW